MENILYWFTYLPFPVFFISLCRPRFPSGAVFPSTWKTSCRSAGNKSLSFWFMNTSSEFLKDSFTGYKILAWQVFFFYLLFQNVILLISDSHNFWWDGYNNLCSYVLKKVFFHQVAFKIFCFSLVFCSLIRVHFGMVSFSWSSLGFWQVYWLHWI